MPFQFSYNIAGVSRRPVLQAEFLVEALYPSPLLASDFIATFIVTLYRINYISLYNVVEASVVNFLRA